MSLNNSLNAVIALVEDRPQVAKEILRARESDVRDIGASTARLYQALDKYVAKRLREFLVSTLSVTPEETDPTNMVIFYDGVRSVEERLENWLMCLEGEE